MRTQDYIIAVERKADELETRVKFLTLALESKSTALDKAIYDYNELYKVVELLRKLP